MFYSIAESIPTIITQLFLPSYTDSYGRKFLIVYPVIGMCVKAVSICLTVYFEGSFWYLVACNIAVGMTGSIFSLFSASFSVVADLTHTENQRTVGIVVMDVVLLFAVVVSSYCSGLFVETQGLNFFYTSVIGSALSITALVLTLWFKESHPKHKRSKPQSIFQTVKRMTDFYVSSEFKGKRKPYIFLLLGFGAATLCGINRGNMETLYFLGQPFCWGPAKIGVFSMVRNAAQAVIGLGSVRLLQLCLSNATIGILSTFSNAVSYIIEGFATSTLMIYMVPVSGMFSFLVIPMVRSLISAMTTKDKQGAVFASLSTIEVICTLAANLSQNTIYTFTMSFMNGFVFLILAVFSLINMLLMIGFKFAKQKLDEKEIEIQVEAKSIKYIHKTENYGSTNNMNI